MELSGEPYVKSQRNEALQNLTGRSKGSIEYKHQNISAVLDRLGHPWINGYKPAVNFQKSLIDGVERHLLGNAKLLELEPPIPGQHLQEGQSLFLEQPPAIEHQDASDNADIQRLVRKFNPAERDSRNRKLGRQGEELVLLSERARLSAAGRKDLALKVEWTSQERGDGAGYDIQSFTVSGEDRLLEVKTTSGHKRTPFYLTENERSFSEERPDAFRLIRLYDFVRTPRAFELSPPLASAVVLSPTNYRASFDT